MNTILFELTTFLQISLISLIIILFWDGIKFFIESIGNVRYRNSESNTSNITSLFSAYNEPNIIKFVETLEGKVSHIIAVNDNSSDSTLDLLCSMFRFDQIHKTKIDGDAFIYFGYTKNGTKYTIINNNVNKGKVNSIHNGLKYVNTPYTFISDADCQLSDDFSFHTDLLNEELDALSYLIIPLNTAKTFFEKMWYKIQTHEYLKSMQLGRKFSDRSHSVECISGAAGLFKTERLHKLKDYHSGEWSGEDLERTLIELYNEGRVGFVEEVIYTEIPLDFNTLTKQRILGWWSGLIRVSPLFFALIFKTNTSSRIKFEAFYTIVNILFDFIKVSILWSLVITFTWVPLIVLHILYTVFEFFLYLRVHKRSSTMTLEKIKTSKLILLIYPVYGVLQLHYRVISTLYKLVKMIMGEVTPLRYNMTID